MERRQRKKRIGSTREDDGDDDTYASDLDTIIQTA